MLCHTPLPARYLSAVALARIGAWIEKRDAALKGTADMLRGASVALLPANFMAVALLARDPEVTHKAILLPVFTLLYIAAAGGGLRRWCAAVSRARHRSLRPACGMREVW